MDEVNAGPLEDLPAVSDDVSAGDLARVYDDLEVFESRLKNNQLNLTPSVMAQEREDLIRLAVTLRTACDQAWQMAVDAQDREKARVMDMLKRLDRAEEKVDAMRGALDTLMILEFEARMSGRPWVGAAEGPSPRSIIESALPGLDGEAKNEDAGEERRYLD